MTDETRSELTRTLARYLSGLGFRNIRSKGTPHVEPFAIEGSGHPIVPDATARSGTALDLFLVLSADELATEEHVRRLRYAVEAAADQKARLWVVVPRGETERAEEELDALGVHVRLLQVDCFRWEGVVR